MPSGSPNRKLGYDGMAARSRYRSYFKEIIEQTAFEARKSEYVDQKSGVSARFTISAMENLVSNAERRAILVGDRTVVPRICDLAHALPGMTGKVELVFEGELEGPAKVSKVLIGKAVREVFKRYFLDPLQKRSKHQGESRQHEDSEYGKIIGWFEAGNKTEIADDMPLDRYMNELDKVKGLRDLTKKQLKLTEANKYELASAMEFVLDGLHQSSRIAKDEVDRLTSYKDLVGSIFSGKGKSIEEEF